jgi:hypothetical protein
MNSNNDFVLVLEKSSHNLKVERTGNDYFLEGIAAVFGKENENQRIYEEREYIPHLEYLNEKITQKRLVGELDHPKEFDVSLKNISHLVESLSYNQGDRTLKIKVKLLDTPNGKIAKSLVDAGIPISISSRAAGNVLENKKVQIKKIFTYDLVADGGFGKSAQLDRVYESLGFSSSERNRKDSVINGLSLINESLGLGNNSDTKIYRIKDQDKIKKLLDKEINKTTSIMENNFVTAEEMNDYSKLIMKEMATIKSTINSIKSIKESAKPETMTSPSSLEERVSKLEKYADYLAENLEASIKYGEYLAENLEDTVSYAKYLAENLDKSISYGKYLAEHLDNNISYSEYIAENVDSSLGAVKTLTEKVNKSIAYSEYVGENLDKNIRYAEYIAENVDKSISYSEYLAEKLDRNISYSEYLAENLDKNISYSEYLAENVDKSISYSEYLAENLDKGLAYAEYLGENLDKNISYAEYLAEKLSNNISYSEYIAEAINTTSGTKEMKNALTQAVSENKNNSGFAGDYSTISSKIDNLINTVGKQKTEQIAEQKNYPFLNLMSQEKQNEFLALHEGQKQKVAKTLNESNYSSEKEIATIMKGALTEQNASGEKFLDLMPEKYRTSWETMNEGQKASIMAQSKFYRLETAYQIQNFWDTRGIKSVKANVQKLDESQNQNAIITSAPKGVSREYLDNLAAALEVRFKK